jgi:hypothetical protein
LAADGTSPAAAIAVKCSPLGITSFFHVPPIRQTALQVFIYFRCQMRPRRQPILNGYQICGRSFEAYVQSPRSARLPALAKVLIEFGANTTTCMMLLRLNGIRQTANACGEDAVSSSVSEVVRKTRV